MEFEWDPRKDAANQRKHGVGFREATTVFGDPLAMTFPDICPDDFLGLPVGYDQQPSVC